MAKRDHYVIYLCIIAAALYWVIDAAVAYVFHYDDSFLSLLFLNKKEVAFRLLFSSCFLSFGLVLSRSFARQKRTERALLSEIAERKQAEERLYAVSVKDELTGLYNRRGFFTLAEQHLRLARRMKRMIFILYADLDGLKKINDHYGHQAGDAALTEAADILRETFRESDIIARIGGDEFIAIPVGTSEETIEIISDRLRKNIELHNCERERRHVISLSFGIARYNPLSPCSIDELLSQVDTLMYEDKRMKRSSASRG